MSLHKLVFSTGETMKLHIRSVSVFSVLWSASGTLAQTASTVRVVLPQEASTEVQKTASVLARQMAERCNARVIIDGEAPFSVELEVAPGNGTDGDLGSRTGRAAA